MNPFPPTCPDAPGVRINRRSCAGHAAGWCPRGGRNSPGRPRPNRSPPRRRSARRPRQDRYRTVAATHPASWGHVRWYGPSAHPRSDGLNASGEVGQRHQVAAGRAPEGSRENQLAAGVDGQRADPDLAGTQLGRLYVLQVQIGGGGVGRQDPAVHRGFLRTGCAILFFAAVPGAQGGVASGRAAPFQPSGAPDIRWHRSCRPGRGLPAVPARPNRRRPCAAGRARRSRPGWPGRGRWRRSGPAIVAASG